MSLLCPGRAPRRIVHVGRSLCEERDRIAPGVGQVTIADRPTALCKSTSTRDAWRHTSFSILQVREALQRQNVEVPGGRVDEGTRERSLRTLGA